MLRGRDFNQLATQARSEPMPARLEVTNNKSSISTMSTTQIKANVLKRFKPSSCNAKLILTKLLAKLEVNKQKQLNQ
jgi:hypothetical protein